MAPEETPRARLARHMAARRGQLRKPWKQVAEEAGLTKEGLRGIRNGEGAIRDTSKAGIEKALRWEHGSIDAILAGGEPTPLEPYAHLSNVRITTTRAPAEDEDDEDPKMKRAAALLAEASALLEEIRRERREGA